MTFFAYIALGLLVGFIGNSIFRRRREAMTRNLVAGLVGATVAGFGFHLLFSSDDVVFDYRSLPAAGFGAIFVVFSYQKLRSRAKPATQTPSAPAPNSANVVS